MNDKRFLVYMFIFMAALWATVLITAIREHLI